MAKKTILAILSLDGCISDNKTERSWILRPDIYGIDKIHATIPEDHLIVATTENLGHIHKFLTARQINQLIIYTVPYISGGCYHLFTKDIPPTHLTLTSAQLYTNDTLCTIYTTQCP